MIKNIFGSFKNDKLKSRFDKWLNPMICLDYSVESILPFDSIIETIIKIDKGSYRIIAKTNAISLDDLNDQDKEHIISIFSDFNNGISKPYQIYIPTFTQDIRDHIQRLENRFDMEETDEIRDWLKDEIEFQKILIQENDINDTQFYLVFSCEFSSSGDEEKDFIRAKKELIRYVKFASDELEPIGLKVLQLTHNEIETLLYYALNPFSVGIQEPKFNNAVINSESFSISNKDSFIGNIDETVAFDLSKPTTSYFEDGQLDAKKRIAPYSLSSIDSPNYIRCAEGLFTVYEIYDYPRVLPKLWAQKLYKYRKNIDISIHIKPIQTSDIIRELDRASVRFGSAMIDELSGDKKKASTMMEKKMENTAFDINMIMDELDNGKQCFFHYSMYILVKSKTVDELNDQCKDIENILGSIRVSFRKCSDNMKNALWSVLPLGEDRLMTTRNMLSTAVANCFPFTNFSFTHKNKEKSFFLGIHKHNMSLIHFNPFELENANGIILGTSGSGKSVTVKKITKGLTSNMDITIRMIDPEGETKLKIFDPVRKEVSSFAKSINAEVIDYFVGSKNKINIFDVEPDDEIDSLIKPQINFIKIFLNYILKDLQKSDIAKIDYSLIRLYDKFGFSNSKDTYWDESRKDTDLFYMGKPLRQVPTMYDLYLIWNSNELVNQIGDTLHLSNQLAEWTRLGSIDLFDGKTNVNFKSKRLIFNLKNLDIYTKEVAIFVLFQKIWDLSRKNPLEQKALITDESHILFRNDSMGEYAYDINKRFRKYGGSAIWVSQNPTDFMKSKWGPEVIKNCSFSILMKQQKGDISILQDMYEMTLSEAMKMTRFNPKKGEAYLIADNYKVPINILLSEKELKTFSTNINDLAVT